MRFFLSLGLFFCFNTADAATHLDASIDTLIQKKIPNASVSILIQELESGKIWYAKNPNQLQMLASNTKLFTAAAALLHFPEQTHFDTQILSDGSNLYFQFKGSPDLTTSDFLTLLTKLETQFPSRIINGNIIIDQTRFSRPYYSDGLSYDDFGWYFAAPTSALILDGNSVSSTWKTSKQIHGPVQIDTHHNQALTLINNLQTASHEEATQHCTLNIEQYSNNTLRVYGCVEQTSTPYTMRLAISEPILYAKKLIQSSLKASRIKIKGKIIEGRTPPHLKLIARFESKPIANLVQHMLLHSDNLYADNIAKQLGFSVRHHGTYKEGMFAIKEILRAQTHLNFQQIKLRDGAGTRYNLSNAQQMVTLLKDMYKKPHLKDKWLSALPVAGVSGTLQNWGKNTALEKHVFAKTGSMQDISTLSGYLILPNKPVFVFSILVNHFNIPLEDVRQFEAEVLKHMITAQIG